VSEQVYPGNNAHAGNANVRESGIGQATRSAALDGIALQHSTGAAMQSTAPYESVQVGVTVATTFRATDAGVSIEVPIHAGPFVTASDVHVTASDPSMTVAWSANDVDSVFVGVAGGFGLSGCRVAGAERTYTFPVGPAGQITVYVEAFAPPEVTQTALGPVRVFYGDVVSVTP